MVFTVSSWGAAFFAKPGKVTKMTSKNVLKIHQKASPKPYKIDAKTEATNNTKNYRKIMPKWSQKASRKNPGFPGNRPRSAPRIDMTTQGHPKSPQGAPKDPRRPPKASQGTPKAPPGTPKGLPRHPKRTPRDPQNPPKGPQGTPNGFQKAPKTNPKGSLNSKRKSMQRQRQ